ncbi:MAG: diacylglycerol kinase family lipid kinase [Lachnospiraceae bacterium]|nr:diacylglycerol kinase family lipid kinase [Lachnospiraceae bacterium]
MEREKVLFIYNPHAGKGTMKNKLSDVMEIFMRADFEVTVYATMKQQEATEIVRETGADYQRIICSGGDGTLHEVTYGLMELPEQQRPRCGYIPTGTVNDFATGIKLPKRILKAAEIAAGQASHAYDVGEMNGQYFTYVAAFGAFTAVSYETSQATKNMFGKTAYLLEGVSQLSSIKSVRVSVTTEDETWEEDCILGMITNAQSVGGLKLFKKKNVKLDDGYFDGIFVRTPKNPLELNMVMNYLLSGQPNQQIHLLHSTQVQIETEEEVAYTLDGENGGVHKKAVITNHKQAITYFHGL